MRGTGTVKAHLVAAGKYHDIDFARLELLKLLAEHPEIRTSVSSDYADTARIEAADLLRSEEHTSELQSLMRISYAVFCLKKKTSHNHSLDIISYTRRTHKN